MYLPFFVARKLTTGGNKSLAASILKMATAVVALCLATMIVSLCISLGFRHEIEDKLMGFAAHVRISSPASSDNESIQGVAFDKKEFDFIRQDHDVKSFQPYITGPGIIKGDSGIIEGISFKGVNHSFDTTFISSHLLDGKFLTLNHQTINEAVISKTTANRLNLKVGQALRVYFVGNELKGRKFTIVGIYETGLEDFDKTFAYCHINILQKLNAWDSNQCTGMEVMLKNPSLIESKTDIIHQKLPPEFMAESLHETFPELMGWLDLVGKNVYIVLILMLAVAIISMITAILVLMIERTSMIGTMKSFGTSNRIITQIFMLLASKLAIWGLFWGNLLSLGFCLLQQKFQWVKLTQETYYMKYVPIEFNWIYILGINLGSLGIIILFMWLPSLIINRISPLTVVKFK